MYCWLFQLYWDMIYISTLLRCLVIGIWQVNTEHVTITMIEIQSISVTPEVLSAYFVVLSLPWKAFLWLLSLYFLQECLVSGAMCLASFPQCNTLKIPLCVARINTSVLFIPDSIPSSCGPQFVHSRVDEHLDCFQFWVIIKLL